LTAFKPAIPVDVLGFFDSAHIDLFTIDPVDRTVFFASRGACEHLGYSLEELLGMSVFDIVPAMGEQAFDAAIETVRTGTPLVRELYLRRRNGSTYPVELRIDVSQDGGEERLTAIAIDQTERKAAQREIELLNRAVNSTSEVVLIYRVDPETGKLQLVYINDAYLRQTGYARDEILGRDMDTFRLAMPDDEGMRAIRAAIAEGRPADAELISYRKDGSTFWNQITVHPIFEDGRITHWVSVEHDISEEVERTSALAEEHDRLLALARAARRLFAVFDERRLIDEVKAVVTELIGADVRVFESGALPSDAGESVARALVERSRVVDESKMHAALYVAGFGEGRFVLDVRVPLGRILRNTDLFVLDLVGAYFAVAARNVALYRELEERRSAVLELNQTKSDLIAMLAHDFRGPLTSIVGYADLLGEVGTLTGEQIEFLESIKRAALQLSDLASDTLTLSRLEHNEVRLHLADVDVAALLAGVVEQYSDRRKVRFETSGDVHVFGDEDRLRQVFTNLIDNAIKYSPNGTEPVVSIAGEADDVTVRVHDRGIGIPAAELSTVFDRFSRGSNARKLRISGTGFGLFLTKQLVQLHGGTIAVESREFEGSTFIVTLPRRVRRETAPRTIVVLDPERDASFIGYGLREGGYRVRMAGSVEEVIALPDAEDADALVVNDGDLTNDQAARLRALRRKHNLPIVAVASDGAAHLGAAAIVPKPVLAGDIMSALNRLLD
jgi:two-component system, sensor histidine kinase and response regulator